MQSESNVSRPSAPADIASSVPLAIDLGASDGRKLSSTPSPIPVRSSVSPIPNWKAVGSPTANPGFLRDTFNDNSDFGLVNKSPSPNINNYAGSDLDGSLRGISIPSKVESSSVPSGGNWGGLGVSWNNQNIWSDPNIGRTSSPNKSSMYAADGFSGISQSITRQALPIIEESIPHYRQQRSFSIAYGQHGTDFLEDLDDKERHRQALGALGEELTDEEYENIFKPRFRSKSSFGTYHFPPQNNFDAVPVPPGFENKSNDTIPSLHPLWGNQPAVNDPAIVNRRRSIANPVGFSNVWNDNIATDPASTGVGAYAQALNAERLERLRQHRRYSLAPSPSFPEVQYSNRLQEIQMNNNRSNIELEQSMNHRRHSVAAPGPAYANKNQTDRFLSEALESIQIDGPIRRGSLGHVTNEMDQYFESDDTRQRSYSELGKGIPLNTLPSQGPLYVVEFKGGRTDLFYIAEHSGVACHNGDLVIVEGDRGKDLGKVINDSITPQQLQTLQQSQAGEGASNEIRSKEIQPKLIYRLAQPTEAALLVSKNQDEAKAMMVCQAKVRQKKLPMEVMDAEYQWDRRKLTFYFIAERRIDFRELVRDLFKIYKTRIWMCAVSTNPIMSLLCATNSQSSNSQSSADISKD